MSITLTVPGMGVALAKRILFLAYTASGVFGMGMLQARSKVTEEDVWGPAPDYALDFNTKPGSKYCDYCFGRMMKFGVEYTDDSVTVNNTTPRLDYQSWARVYPSVEELLIAAQLDLGLLP